MSETTLLKVLVEARGLGIDVDAIVSKHMDAEFRELCLAIRAKKRGGDGGVSCGKCGQETYRVFTRDIPVITVTSVPVCSRCAHTLDGQAGPGRRGQRKNIGQILATINEKNLHGRVLSTDQVRLTFGYGPLTNIYDTVIRSRDFAVPVGPSDCMPGNMKWRFK